MTTSVTRRRFTVDEYECMGRAGILHEDERVELIDGAVIGMPALGSRHAARVDHLFYWWIIAVPNRATVRGQNPIRLATHSAPEPDIALVRYRADFYATGHPRPEDVLLLIEVADSSLTYDRATKAPMYAAAGIAELWLLDLVNNQLEVYRDPFEGAFRTLMRYQPEASVTPLAFPDITITVAEMLG